MAPLLPANDSLLYSYVASSETLSSAMISPLHTILGKEIWSTKLISYLESQDLGIVVELRNYEFQKRKLRKEIPESSLLTSLLI